MKLTRKKEYAIIYHVGGKFPIKIKEFNENTFNICVLDKSKKIGWKYDLDSPQEIQIKIKEK